MNLKNGSLIICIIFALVSVTAMMPIAHAAIINAKPFPSADFTGTPQSGYAPLTVMFNATSNGTGPLTYAWDFGDASPENATVKDPVHTFANIGSYNVSLTVSNPVASTNTTKTNYIMVIAPPVAPVADFTGSPQSGIAPLTVTFIDNSTGTALLTWAWDFGDGSAENATQQNPVHTYANFGTYNVSLMVSNIVGSNTTIKTDYITVTPLPVSPAVDFSGTPRSGAAPLTVTFIDQSTGTAPLTYAWDFGDASPENATQQSPVHTYANVGTYNVSLTVSNIAGNTTSTKTDFITVTAAPVAPQADFVGTPQSGRAPLTVTFFDNSTGTEPLTWAWDFGDGSAENATVQNPIHTYVNVGVYNVSLTASNAVGNNTMNRTGYISVTNAVTGKTAVGVFRPSAHTFYLRNGTAASWTTTVIDWGMSTDLPVTGDWNGDGLTDIGGYRPSAHTFYLKNGTAVSWTTTVIDWGVSTDLPVTGDWNGDGLTDVGVYRPSAHTFYLKNGTAVSWTTTVIDWGVSTDLPVTGDWNGDGLTDAGVYRPSAHTFYLKNGTAVSWTTTAIDWGISTDLPVTGDWNGDGVSEMGVYRPSTHTFYLRSANYPVTPANVINWGVSTDLPVTGIWN
jgi:PKD repeat protein